MKKILFLFLLILVNCSENNIPTAPEESDAYNNFLIETDSLAYAWQQEESGFSIAIYGTINNVSDSVFYSRIGELFSGDTPCCFSGNSDAYLEKYDPSEDIWRVNNIASLLFEGTKSVAIEPAQHYSFSSYLFSGNDQDESGTYRFRLDYYTQENPDSGVAPYFDYSNEFVLK